MCTLNVNGVLDVVCNDTKTFFNEANSLVPCITLNVEGKYKITIVPQNPGNF